MADIITLASGKEFRTLKELQKYAETLYLIAETANEKIKELEEKLKHSEDLLLSTQVVAVIKTQEQCIVEKQIDVISGLSMTRQLTNEEVKSLDILIKNKLLLSGQPTTIAGDVKKKKEVSMRELTLIAQKKD
jgi:hypothetical protein